MTKSIRKKKNQLKAKSRKILFAKIVVTVTDGGDFGFKNCELCGQEIVDSTEPCPSCGARFTESVLSAPTGGSDF